MRNLFAHVVIAGVAAVATLVPIGTAATTRENRAAATTVQVTGGEFWFKPSTKTLPKPGRVTFAFKNVGHIPHDFKILGKSTPVISPGKTSSITVTFGKPGSYPYTCTVAGHAAGGMKGVFTVR